MSDHPSYLNPHFSKKNISSLHIPKLFEQIREGNITALSQGITLLESELPEHADMSKQLLHSCLPHAGNSMRIGITGIPGAGKSTFIEAIGKEVLHHSHKMAILAIDPSSSVTKGSILGDKTRMEELSKHKNVFIRPTPTSGNLGGIARTTRESMILCEAAGYDVVMIETVGVGQSEIELYYLTDIFILLLIPGAGDELQGIKRGIMEMADLILINKADKENDPAVQLAIKQLENAIHYMQSNPYGRSTVIKSVSSLHHKNIPSVWKFIGDNITGWKKDKTFFQKRRDQGVYWFDQSLHNGLKNIIHQRKEWENVYMKLKQEVESGAIHPFTAADELLKKIIH